MFKVLILLTLKISVLRADNSLSPRVSHLAQKCLQTIVSDRRFSDCANNAEMKWRLNEENEMRNSTEECCLAYAIIDCKFLSAKLICSQAENVELISFKEEIIKANNESHCNIYEMISEKCNSHKLMANIMNVLLIIAFKILI
jgi:hypothetical protein